MENLDIEGIFWLAAKPDNKVAGRLKFDAIKGADLSLIGSFHNQLSPGKTELEDLFGSERPVRIQGIAGTKTLTLCDSVQSKMTMNIPGIGQEAYHSPLLLTGHHFNEEDPIGVQAVNVRLRPLESWIGKSGVQVKLKTEEDKGFQRLCLTYTAPEECNVQAGFGRIQLKLGGSLQDRRPLETTIRENCLFRLAFHDTRSLDESVSLCSAIQDLVTIGLDAPSVISGLSINSSVDLKSSSPIKSQELKVYAQLTGADTQPDQTSTHPSKMLFTFEEIGELAGVARWVETTSDYPSVVGILVNHWYVPQLYVDNRFFNTYTAAETLRRIQLGKQQINMKRELKVLVDKAGYTFTRLVGDVDSWIAKVIRVRNNRVFHRGLHESSEGLTIYLLAESLYFLVVLCLLRECDVPADTLTKIQEHERFRLLTKDLKALA